MRLKALSIVLLLSLVAFTMAGAPGEPTLGVNSTAVRTGSPVRIEGSGFAGSSDFQLFLDEQNIANGTTYPSGSLYRTINLPRTISLGSHNISVRCAQDFASTEITVIQWSPNISLSISQARPGEEVMILGQGFPPKAYFEAYLGSRTILRGATDGQGMFSDVYRLPKDESIGDKEVRVATPKYTGPPSASASLNITRWSPSLAFTPCEPNPGGTLVIDGSVFPPGAIYRILLDGKQILIGTADPSGNFSRSYVLDKAISLGEHMLSAEATEYGGPPSISRKMTVVQWPTLLEAQPANPHPCSRVTFVGTGFPPQTPFLLSFDGLTISSGNTSKGGEFSVEYQLPANASIGPHTATAMAETYAGPPSSSVSVNVTQWPLNLLIEPEEAHPGGRINLTGEGFPPSASYEVWIDSTRIGSGVSNASGCFRLTHLLPIALSFGEHIVTSVAHGFTGPPTLSCRFEVSPWQGEVSIFPLRPHPGQEVRISGSGYPPQSACLLIIDGQQVGEVPVDELGSFEENHLLPRNLSLGEHNLSVTCTFPRVQPVAVAFVAVQWPARLWIDPQSGPPGTIIEAHGQGYPPSVTMGLFWDGQYVKATQSSREGAFSTSLLARGEEDYSHHALRVEAAGFSGPPSCRVYFWLGSAGAPAPHVLACNDAGEAMTSFFVGDTIYVTVTGLPASIDAKAFLLPEGETPQWDTAVSSADVHTDANGSVPPTAIYSTEEPAVLRPWIDVNANGIFDGNDVLGGTFGVVSRPDLAIEEAKVSEMDPVQGRMVDIRVRLRNDGQRGEVGFVRALYRGVQVATSVTRPLDPGERLDVALTWDTLSMSTGTGNLMVVLEPLPGEEALENNNRTVGSVRIRPRPDIGIIGLRPTSREVHAGKIIGIRVRLANWGEGRESFNLSVNWGSEEIARVETSLDAGERRWTEVDWDTSGTDAGRNPIMARVDVLPYEKRPEDNVLNNGSVSILPPNHPPEADSGGPYRGRSHAVMTFDGSYSFDIDGSIVSYLWRFGDGSMAWGRRVNHTYDEEGVYEVVLTVADDDGDSDSARTEAVVEASPPTFGLSITVLDSLTLLYVRGAKLRVGTSEYVFNGQPLKVQLEEGRWSIQATAPGYAQAREDVLMDRSKNLSLSMVPIFALFTCDGSGKARYDFSSNEVIYVSLEAAGEYPALLYVVPDGVSEEGKALVDVTGEGQKYVLTERRSSILPVWRTRHIKGPYDIVLDLDLDGVLDDGDVVYAPEGPGFVIAETSILSFLCVVVGPAMKVLFRG